jgi:HAD superfamily hydrolase (TIGR01509 family)
VFDTIAVDLGGVAARFVPERRLAALADATGLRADDVDHRIFDQGMDARLERGEFDSVNDALERVVAALDHRVDVPTLVQSWSRAFEPDADVLNILHARAEAVVLFTNNGPIVDACLDGPLRSVKDACDAVVCSWRLRAVKPDAEAFERFAETLDKTPDQLLLVDDSPANVDGARRAGWAAALVASATDLARVLADFQ